MPLPGGSGTMKRTVLCGQVCEALGAVRQRRTGSEREREQRTGEQ